MYVPQSDDIEFDCEALEAEAELDFDTDVKPEGDYYRFTDTLTLS